jgi:hypothetical protein
MMYLSSELDGSDDIGRPISNESVMFSKEMDACDAQNDAKIRFYATTMIREEITLRQL